MAEKEASLPSPQEKRVGRDPVKIDGPSIVRLGSGYTFLVLPPDPKTTSTFGEECAVYGREEINPFASQFTRVHDTRIEIGRASQDNQLKVPLGQTDVSPRHAVIARGVDGSYYITDADSPNGTFISPVEAYSKNNSSIDPGKWKRVRLGDGKIVLTSQGLKNSGKFNFRPQELSVQFISAADSVSVSPVIVGNVSRSPGQIGISPDAVFHIGYGDLNEQYFVPVIPPPSNIVIPFSQNVATVVRRGEELFIHNIPHRSLQGNGFEAITLHIDKEFISQAKEIPESIATGKLEPQTGRQFPVPEREANKPIVFALVNLGGTTDKGGRKNNEDNFLWWQPAIPEWIIQSKEEWTSRETEDLRAGNILVVADGVGGLEDGEIASKDACRAFIDSYLVHIKKTDDARIAMVLALQDTNIAIHEPDLEGKGRKATTIACAIVKGEELFVASVGDSRVYFYRDGKLERLTEDDSWKEKVRTNPSLRKEFRERYGYSDPVGTELSMSIGRISQLEGVKEHVRGPLPLRSGDTIVLCTDGVWGYVPEDVIADVIAAGGSASSQADELKNAALERQTTDNVGVIVANIQGFSRTDVFYKQIAGHNRRVRLEQKIKKIRGLFNRK